MKIRYLLALTLLGMGLAVAPFATGVADAKSGCTPRGKHKHYPPGQCKLGVSDSNPKPGETITVDGEGYGSNTSQDLTIQSAPKHLVNAQSNADGDFVQDLTIPCDTTPGDHTLFATGVNPDGSALALSAGINVQNVACVLGTQTTATTTASNANANANEQARGTTSSSLPFTGSAATALLLALAVGMIAAGSVAVSVARRRRHAGV